MRRVVDLLREAAERLETGEKAVFIPGTDDDAVKRAATAVLEGSHVQPRDLGGLVYYLADMLEE